ncbi:hypothetical protein CBR_g54508 [Chara braunii]|uniref:DUF659 domain-containing protein n=1 Tax=Chara braunii TaxID=69332 RepID=A0A388MC66_CHABU|nr:hypothetical protein CBR_g54508 [Chara braunii]|eukprot:GBG92157.1 hypothetical protein CBR_g54508 [Chara braunii]
MGAGCSHPLQHEARVRGPTKQTSIARYTKNPRQEEIDDSANEFFVENAIPFNVAKSRSFKKFQLTCYGPQPAVSKPLVPTSYNPLRCRLLDRLRSKLEKKEQVIRDDWEVTGCTFITDDTTYICGRSLMNYILAGCLKPVFVKCEDVSVRDKDAPAVVAGWKQFFREFGVEKITTICTDSLAGNKSVARMLWEDPETHYVMLHRLQVCETVLVRIVTGCPWESMVWRGEIRVKAYVVEEFILDKAFWVDVKKLIALMKGPYDALREVDKDAHCLSRIYNMASRLRGIVRSARVTADEQDAVLHNVGKRTDMLLSPIHVVTRLQDPQLRDIAVFSNVELMAQFNSVIERLIGKKGSKRFDDCKDQLARGKDGPTIAGGWLGLEKDWVDEYLEGDMANVTDAVDDGEAGGTAAGSAAGSTNIARAPSTTRSASVHRLGEMEEVAEGDEVEDDAGEEDESDEDKDDVPGEEWVDERSDSDRLWTRREEILPYVSGTRFSDRLRDQRAQREQQGHHEEDHPLEEYLLEHQQEEEQSQERQQEEHPQDEEEHPRTRSSSNKTSSNRSGSTSSRRRSSSSSSRRSTSSRRGRSSSSRRGRQRMSTNNRRGRSTNS